MFTVCNKWLPNTVILNCVFEMCCLLLIKQCYVETPFDIELNSMCLSTVYVYILYRMILCVIIFIVLLLHTSTKVLLT
jgi:hypothetical protein